MTTTTEQETATSPVAASISPPKTAGRATSDNQMSFQVASNNRMGNNRTG